MRHIIPLEISPQPSETTCGPTCLHAIYEFYGESLPLEQVIQEVTALDGGGTFGVLLASHALRRGYQATIYSYNLTLFDPTWFDLEQAVLIDRLELQRRYKTDVKLQLATGAYLEFLELGGSVRLADLSEELIVDYLARSTPVLTGLSATYLYSLPRELGPDYDDVRGEPAGHFVVLCGYDPQAREALIADPLVSNPMSKDLIYPVKLERLVASILLGIVTYDANLVVIEPPPRPPGEP